MRLKMPPQISQAPAFWGLHALVATHLTALLFSLVSHSVIQAQTTNATSVQQKQQDSEKVYVPIAWKKGDVRRYKVTTKSGTETKNGIEWNSVVEKEIQFEVTGESKQSLFVQWKLELNKTPSPNQMTKRIAEIYKGVVIKTEVGRDGVFKTMTNWDEVNQANRKLKALTQEILDDVDVAESVKQTVWKQAMAQAGTREAIEAKMTENLTAILTMTGSEFDTLSPETYETEMATAMYVLPAVETYSVESIDRKSGRILIKWTQHADKQKSPGIIERRATELMKQQGKPGPPAGAFNGYVAEQEATYDYELNTGWARKITNITRAGLPAKLNVRHIVTEQIETK